jgi:phosphoglycolate phosphatase-like HAD superfamily hydrolase
MGYVIDCDIQKCFLLSFVMTPKILLWDNDGTIMGSKNPNDPTKVFLPGVLDAMEGADFNFVISGLASPESESQDFDPDTVAARFINLMGELPISAAAFSPLIGGVACFVVIKKPDGVFVIKKAHEEARYKNYIGHFKKPGVGMFVVMRDVAAEEFGVVVDRSSSVMIGDTWHDEAAASEFGVGFLNAHEVHHRAAKSGRCC